MTEPIEQRLRDSLHAQADRFEPSDDSLVRLQHRLAESPHDQRSVSAPRALAMAAAVVVLVGTAVILANRQPDQQLEVIPADVSSTTTTTQPEVALPTTTALVETTMPEVIPEVEYPEVGYSTVAGPREMSPDGAAFKFMEQIRITPGRIVLDGHQALVYSNNEDGSPSDRLVSTLDIVTIPSWDKESMSYAVISATSTDVELTSPTAGATVTDQKFVVGGTGRGWEANISINLFSNSDGVVLGRTYATAGMSELAPFTADLTVVGRDSGFVVAQSSTGADNVIAPFAAIPIEWDAGQDPTEYTVSHLTVDDPDGGLNVRDQPGFNVGEVLATLPPDTSGIRRRGRVPSNVDGDVWWDIITDEGLNGWVNSRYLVRVSEIPTETLDAIGNQFAEALQNPDPNFLTALPWSVDKPVMGGWFGSLETFRNDELLSPEWWDTPRDWGVPEETFSTTVETNSPRAFINLPAGPWILDSRSPDTVDHHSCGYCRSVVEWTMPGLSAVTVSLDGEFDIDDRTVTLYLEDTTDGPKIVALATWIWTP